MNVKQKNIYIVGYSGSGKTEVGEALAKQLHYDFVDMDQKIQEEQNETLNRIVMTYGEHHLRNLEGKSLEEWVCGEYKNLVISCSEGIVLDDKNRKVLKNEYVVFLDCDTRTMFQRIKDKSDSPNAYFNMKDEEKKYSIFSEKYFMRRKLYEEVCDVRIDTGRGSIDSSVGEILSKGMFK